MLAHQDKQKVVELLRPVLSKAGFERRESIWYRFSAETIQVLEIEAASARSKQRLYINLGATFRNLHPPTHFRLFDCLLYGRLDLIIPPNEPFASVTDFGDPMFSSERLQRIADFIQCYAFPLLDSWQSIGGVKAFSLSDKSKGFNIKQPLKDLCAAKQIRHEPPQSEN